MLIAEHYNRKRNDNHTDCDNQNIKRSHHPGAFALLLPFCFLCKSSGKGITAHRRKLSSALSRYYKASRQKLVSARFPDLVRLARKKRFVNINLALAQNGIGRNLISAFKLNNIVKHKLLAFYIKSHAASYNLRSPLRKEIELVKRSP